MTRPELVVGGDRLLGHADREIHMGSLLKPLVWIWVDRRGMTRPELVVRAGPDREIHMGSLLEQLVWISAPPPTARRAALIRDPLKRTKRRRKWDLDQRRVGQGAA